MTITVKDARFNFIWFETSLALLAEPAPHAPHAFLGRAGSYATTFRAARTRSPDAAGLKPPWPQTGSHKFWWYYLGHDTPLCDVKGSKAWNALVPLRIRIPVTLGAAWFPGTISAEGYLYPHGHALVVSARLSPKEPLPLRDTVILAQAVRRDKSLDATWNNEAAASAKLDMFAERALTWLRTAGLGEDARRGTREVDPYSVVTFVRTDGASATEPIAADGEIRRALEATTTWRSSWEVDTLHPLETAVAHIERRSPAGHVMYVDRRGQAAWFPEKASFSASERHSLGCYDRNQLFGALQVESLGGLMRCIDAAVQRGDQLSQTEEDCARHASGVLGRLLGGHDSVYKSGSIRAHIERTGFVEPTNAVRSRYGMDPLATT